jgi:hypothetical protein
LRIVVSQIGITSVEDPELFALQLNILNRTLCEGIGSQLYTRSPGVLKCVSQLIPLLHRDELKFSVSVRVVIGNAAQAQRE